MKKLYKHKFNGKPNLIVVFQSMNAHLYTPGNKNKFELEKTFSRLDLEYSDLLFIKDDVRPRDSKLGGFYLHSETVDEICLDLRNLVRQYKKTLFTGLSAGGFASILFGSLCFIDVVVAINPQTTLYDFYTGDLLTIGEQNPLRDNSNYYDLKPHINKTTNYYISKRATTLPYEQCSQIEKLHHVKMIEHINDFSNVYVREDLNQTYSALKDILEINNFKM
jgi:hypothetical protein